MEKRFHVEHWERAGCPLAAGADDNERPLLIDERDGDLPQLPGSADPEHEDASAFISSASGEPL